MAGERILAIEDNALNAKLLRDALGAFGYEVVEATTAEDGLELARANRPDLILMDIHLPGMSGIDALAILKRDAELGSVPVVAVTASAMPMERREILAAGFDGYQPKPLSVKELRSEIERLLGQETSP